MKSPGLSLIAGVVLLLNMLHSATVLACHCVDPLPRQSYFMATIIVVGVAESVEQKDDVSVAKLTVERAWKTNVPSRLSVIVGKACSVDLVSGQKYLLYGTKVDETSFGTRRCRGDELCLKAGAAIAWLVRNGREAEVQHTGRESPDKGQ